MAFTEQDLIPHLPDLDRPGRWWVGYSGGMDSQVLLVALHALLRRHPGGPSLHAIHVHHGISANADAWQAHCAAQCAALGVDFQARRVSLDGAPGESLETRARHARYRVFEEVLEEGDVLFQAHHGDDQLETLLYRLARGSGPLGLAGMPARRRLGHGELRRPLLGFARRELEAYARAGALRWVEDESNVDTRFDRNFLRGDVLPRLQERWPGLPGWRRSMALCGEAAELLDELARLDLAKLRTNYPNVIEAAPLHELSDARRRNLLRCWLTELRDEFALPAPDFHSLRRISTEVLAAAADAVPLVSWEGEGGRAEVRRFAGKLHALRPIMRANRVKILEWTCAAALSEGAADAPSEPAGATTDRAENKVPHDPRYAAVGGLPPLALGPGLGTLHLEPVARGGFPLAEVGPLQVRFRSGGESAKPHGRRTRPLKKILQDYGVPPWLRDHVPLVYAGDRLLAVADLFLCEPWERDNAAAALFRIRWERPLIHCGY